MKNKIFIDVGFYRGAILRKYIDQDIVDDTWDIYAFEANPDLKTVQHIADFFTDISIHFINKAAWVDDKGVWLHISGRDDAASVANTASHVDPKEVSVRSINFSEFVSKLPEAYIICSMDIEGAEYVVLEKMIADGTISRLNELDIEFHHRLMNDKDEQSSQVLIDELLRLGIKLKLKVPLN